MPKVRNEVSDCVMSVNPTSYCTLLAKHMLSPKFVAVCNNLVNASNFDAVSQQRHMINQFSTHQMTVVKLLVEHRGNECLSNTCAGISACK